MEAQTRKQKKAGKYAPALDDDLKFLPGYSQCVPGFLGSLPYFI
jgi:hypothetical protein